MIYTPPKHVWAHTSWDLEKPGAKKDGTPYEFVCQVCGAHAYLQERFDRRTNEYLWPRDDGCDPELALFAEVMEA